MGLITSKECTIILEKCLKIAQLQIINFEIMNFSEMTLGYLGDHLLLKILYENSEIKSVRELSFFVKCIPRENTKLKDFIRFLGVIHKEAHLYQNLILKLNTLVSAPFCPEFYYGRNDIIVLENLKEKGYSMTHEVYFDISRVKAALSALARMHAASFIYENERSTPSKKYRIIDDIKEELSDYKYDFIKGNSRYDWYKVSTNCVVELCKYFSDNEEIQKHILEYVKYDVPGETGPSTRYPNVFCHNDLWSNNLMFNNNDCRLVDFQFAKYAPPAYDVLLHVYFNTERTFLERNFTELLNFYYEILESELKKRSLNIIDIMPKNIFLESVKSYSKPALLQVALSGTYVFISEELNQHKTENEEVYEDFNFGNRSNYILNEIERNEDLRKRFSNVILPLCKMFE